MRGFLAPRPPLGALLGVCGLQRGVQHRGRRRVAGWERVGAVDPGHQAQLNTRGLLALVTTVPSLARYWRTRILHSQFCAG
jgi:hypothetical protein